MKQKQTLLKIFLLAPVLAGLLSLTKPVYANTLLDWFGKKAITFLGEAVLHLIMTLVDFWAWLIAAVVFPPVYLLLNTLILNENVFLTGEAYEVTETIWNFTLNIANGIFLLALIIASVAIILRVNTGIYNIKKVLSGLVIAVILSNSSFLIMRVFLAIGSQLTTMVKSLFPGGMNAPSDVIKGIYMSVTSGSLIVETLAEKTIFAVTIALLLMVLGKLILLLVNRTIWIFFLTILAPLVFALGLLPSMEKYVKEWWEKLLKWILVFPMVMFMLIVAKMLLDSSNNSLLLTDWEIYKRGDNDFFSASTLISIAGLAILYFAGSVDKFIKLGAVGFEDIAKGVKSVSKVASSQPVQYLRQGVGAGLDLATSGLDKKSSFSKLGTKIGAIMPTKDKFLGALKKSKEMKSSQQASRNISAAIPHMPSDMREAALAGTMGDNYEEIRKRKAVFSGTEPLLKTLYEANDINELQIAEGVINSFISNPNSGASLEERQDLFDAAREFKAYNDYQDPDMQESMTDDDKKLYKNMNSSYEKMSPDKKKAFEGAVKLEKIRREDSKMKFSKFDSPTSQKPRRRGEYDDEENGEMKKGTGASTLKQTKDTVSDKSKTPPHIGADDIMHVQVKKSLKKAATDIEQIISGTLNVDEITNTATLNSIQELAKVDNLDDFEAELQGKEDLTPSGATSLIENLSDLNKGGASDEEMKAVINESGFGYNDPGKATLLINLIKNKHGSMQDIKETIAITKNIGADKIGPLKIKIQELVKLKEQDAEITVAKQKEADIKKGNYRMVIDESKYEEVNKTSSEFLKAIKNELESNVGINKTTDINDLSIKLHGKAVNPKSIPHFMEDHGIRPENNNVGEMMKHLRLMIETTRKNK